MVVDFAAHATYSRSGLAPLQHSSRQSWAEINVGRSRVFFIFIFFKIVFYINIFSVSQFTGLYPYRPTGGGRGLYVIKISVLSHGDPYRPAGGRQAPPNIKAEVPLYLQQTTSIEGKRRDVG
jgi:hypothetical protein